MSRAVHINGVEYRYKVGRSNVVAYAPSGAKIVGNFSEVTGWSWNDIERGAWKRHFSITPAQVKAWLNRRLWGINSTVVCVIDARRTELVVYVYKEQARYNEMYDVILLSPTCHEGDVMTIHADGSVVWHPNGEGDDVPLEGNTRDAIWVAADANHYDVAWQIAVDAVYGAP